MTIYCKIITININLVSNVKKENRSIKQNKNKAIKIKQIYESKTVNTRILITVSQIKSKDKYNNVL